MNIYFGIHKKINVDRNDLYNISNIMNIEYFTKQSAGAESQWYLKMLKNVKRTKVYCAHFLR